MLFTVCCLLFTIPTYVEPTHAYYHLGRPTRTGKGGDWFVGNGIPAEDSCRRAAATADRRAVELSHRRAERRPRRVYSSACRVSLQSDRRRSRRTGGDLTRFCNGLRGPFNAAGGRELYDIGNQGQ